jgi:protein-tyrosine phosphatase
MPSVLFVCRANQFRSPIAAACFQHAIKQLTSTSNWVVESAGTWTKPGLPVPKVVLQITHRLGLTGLSRHVSRQLDEKILSSFDLVVVMEAGQKESIVTEFPTVRQRVYLLSEVVDGTPYDIADPAIPGIDPDEVADEIYSLINKGTVQLMKLANSLQVRQKFS